MKREWRSRNEPYGISELREVGITKLIADERNRLWLCDRHHQRVEKGNDLLRLSEIPVPVFRFAYEFGLEAALDRAIRKFRR